MAKSSKRIVLGRASYSAQQMGGQLLLFAGGVHPTSGYREFFEIIALERPTPEFTFLFLEPAGIVSPVVTPFQHHERFPMEGRADEVVIRDVDGRHEVVVERFPESVVVREEAVEGIREVAVAAAELAVTPAAPVSCDVCVRGTVALWANNDSFNNSQTLGQVYRRGSCNNGALSQLFQAVQARCGRTPRSISCSTTVRQFIRSTCP